MLYDRDAALWGAALVAGSSVLIQYSTNARGYTLGTLFVVLALVAATWAARVRRVSSWAVLGAASVLAIYSVPTMAAGIVVAFGWVAVGTVAAPRSARPRPALRDAIDTAGAAALVTIALYWPTLRDDGWVSPYVQEAHSASEKWDAVTATWTEWNDAWPLAVELLVATAFLLALAAHRRIARDPVPLAGVAVGVIALAGLLLPLSPLARTYMQFLPIYLVTAGAGLALAVGVAARRMRVPATAVNAGGAVLAAAGLALGIGLRGDDAYSIDPPRSDERVADFAPPGRTVVASVVASVPVSFDLRRKGLPGALTQVPAEQRAAVVAVVPHDGETPAAVIGAAGASLAPGSRPELLGDFRWLDVYEVELAR